MLCQCFFIRGLISLTFNILPLKKKKKKKKKDLDLRKDLNLKKIPKYFENDTG